MPILSGTTTALVARLAGAAVILLAAALQALLRKANFNPSQPRVPRGNPDGGQWTRVGDGANDAIGPTLVSDKPTLSGPHVVDLQEEEAAGGHTIAAHVGWSPQALLERVQRGTYPGLFNSTVMYRAGSFPSLAAAHKLINSTLSRKRAIVDEVASGLRKDAFVTATFSSKTGIEAFRSTPYANPYLRDTYGVGIWIVHDRKAKNGFRILPRILETTSNDAE